MLIQCTIGINMTDIWNNSYIRIYIYITVYFDVTTVLYRMVISVHEDSDEMKIINIILIVEESEKFKWIHNSKKVKFSGKWLNRDWCRCNYWPVREMLRRVHAMMTTQLSCHHAACCCVPLEETRTALLPRASAAVIYHQHWLLLIHPISRKECHVDSGQPASGIEPRASRTAGGDNMNSATHEVCTSVDSQERRHIRIVMLCEKNWHF